MTVSSSRTRGCAAPAGSRWCDGGEAERLPVDPDGRFGPAGDGAAYRIEFEAAARVFRGQAAPAFGRADAIEQAAVLEAVRAAAETRTTVVLPAAGA